MVSAGMSTAGSWSLLTGKVVVLCGGGTRTARCRCCSPRRRTGRPCGLALSSRAYRAGRRLVLLAGGVACPCCGTCVADGARSPGRSADTACGWCGSVRPACRVVAAAVWQRQHRQGDVAQEQDQRARHGHGVSLVCSKRVSRSLSMRRRHSAAISSCPAHVACSHWVRSSAMRASRVSVSPVMSLCLLQTGHAAQQPWRPPG